MRRLLLAGLLLAPSSLAAQGQAAPAAPAPPPRDTTPPEAVFGVTEYQLARQKLELDLRSALGGKPAKIVTLDLASGRLWIVPSPTPPPH